MCRYNLSSLTGDILIFIASVLGAVLVLLAERIVGIDWDYHPDAVTYLTTYEVIVTHITGLLFLNNSYFFVINFVNGSLFFAVTLNICIFGITNIIIIRFINNNLDLARFNWLAMVFLYALIIYSPYRLHLSVHVLKDTLIIFFICGIFTKKGLSFVMMALLPLLRIASVLYIFPLIKRKYYIVLFPAVLIVFIVFYNEIVSILVSQNSVDMRFREFDNIPSFGEMGLPGVILRAILWPILAFTGLFAVISPSLPYFAVALSSLFTLIWLWVIQGRIRFNIQSYLVMSFIAVLSPGFTTYIRYVFPLIVVMPIIGIIKEKYKLSLVKENENYRVPLLQ